MQLYVDFPSHRVVVGWEDIGDSHQSNNISNALEGLAQLYGSNRCHNIIK